MQGMSSEIRIEESATAFLPILTVEAAAWIADSTVSLSRALSSGRVDSRVRERLHRVVILVARFTPSDVLLEDGRQRASFTYRQLSEELGLGAESTQAVQRALRALSLSSRPTDPSSYRLASDLICRERGGDPILRPLAKSDRRGHASIWELVGIKPRRGFASSEASVVAAPEPVVEKRRPVVEKRRPVVESPGSVVENRRPVVSFVNPDCTTSYRGRSDLQGASSCEDGVSHHIEFGQSVVQPTACRDGLSTTSHHSSFFTPPAMSGYRKAVLLFQCRPGRKEEETIEAYERLISRGYSSAAIVGGIERYMSATPLSEQKRFPLRFLADDDLVRRWCGTPEKRVDARSLLHSTGGWVYPFADGADCVDCDSDASRAEAEAAVRRMVEQGIKKL